MTDSSKLKSDLKKDVALARKIAKGKFSDAKKKLVKAEKDVESYIERNPKKAAAIAVGVGMAVGAALTAVAAAVMRRK